MQSPSWWKRLKNWFQKSPEIKSVKVRRLRIPSKLRLEDFDGDVMKFLAAIKKQRSRISIFGDLFKVLKVTKDKLVLRHERKP